MLGKTKLGDVDLPALEEELKVDCCNGFLRLVSLAHREFGLAVREKRSAWQYLQAFMADVVTVRMSVKTPKDVLFLRTYLVLIIAIGAVDMLATQPHTGLGENRKVHRFPELTDAGKTHRGGEVAQTIDIDGNALDFRNRVLAEFDDNVWRILRKI